MAVVTSQPLTTIAITQNIREWTSPALACTKDMKICLCGAFLLPCLACKVAQHQNESCIVPTCIYGGVMAMRTKMRTAHGIQGSILNDCLIYSCCLPCGVCQMAREQKAMGQWS